MYVLKKTARYSELIAKKAGSRLVQDRKDVSKVEPHVKVACLSLDYAT